MASTGSATADFGDKTHSVYDVAIRAVHQFKRGLEKFEQGGLTTNELFALKFEQAGNEREAICLELK